MRQQPTRSQQYVPPYDTIHPDMRVIVTVGGVQQSPLRLQGVLSRMDIDMRKHYPIGEILRAGGLQMQFLVKNDETEGLEFRRLLGVQFRGYESVTELYDTNGVFLSCLKNTSVRSRRRRTNVENFIVPSSYPDGRAIKIYDVNGREREVVVRHLDETLPAFSLIIDRDDGIISNNFEVKCIRG